MVFSYPGEGLEQFQGQVQDRLDQLSNGLLSNATLVEDVDLSGTTKRVPTGLQLVQGYIVVRRSAAVHVFDEGVDGGSVLLKTGGTAVTVSLLVF